MKYDLIANELSFTYKRKVKIIPYVMIWEGLVKKYHKKHRSEIGISTKTVANKLWNKFLWMKMKHCHNNF